MVDQDCSVCNIRFVGKARSGQPRYWCLTHKADASGKNGPLSTCELGLDSATPTNVINLDPVSYPGGVALWGAVPPIYDTTHMPPERGVHLHARRSEADEKEIDGTFDAVVFPYGQDLIERPRARIDGRAAVAYYLANFAKNKIECVSCSHCGELHLDEGEFAFRLHKRHLCHACGRYFTVKQACVSNPLALLRSEVGCIDREPRESTRKLVINQEDFPGGIQIWASNPAIIWLANRNEEAGIHVHTYDAAGKIVVDETYGHVEIDGQHLPNEEVAYLMAQQTAPWLANRINAINCDVCSTPLFSRGRLAFEPAQELICDRCGFKTQTKGRTAGVANPLVAKLEKLRIKAAGGVDERLYLHHGHKH